MDFGRFISEIIEQDDIYDDDAMKLSELLKNDNSVKLLRLSNAL